MLSIKPPCEVEDGIFKKKITIFLAWSIEQGKAEKWQQIVETWLSDKDVVILNPRRDDWNPSWKEDINNEEFTRQVNWELDGLDKSKIAIFYFDPATKSPVTMYELGLCTNKWNLIVCCPDWFHKKWNIDIVCRRNNIQEATNLEDLISKLRVKVDSLL